MVYALILTPTVEIVSSPESVAVEAGDSAEFSCSFVLALDNPYQLKPVWYLNGTKLVDKLGNFSASLNATSWSTSNTSTLLIENYTAALNLTMVACGFEIGLSYNGTVESEAAVLTLVLTGERGQSAGRSFMHISLSFVSAFLCLSKTLNVQL